MKRVERLVVTETPKIIFKTLVTIINININVLVVHMNTLVVKDMVDNSEVVLVESKEN